MSSGATWRPPQWQTTSASKVLITFPGQGNAPQYSGTAGSNATLPATQTLYAFDAELEIEHQQELRRTEHPVQTGTSISDHAYIVPARLVLDVGMSDAMDAYYNPTTWSGSTSKSVSAYQTMLALQFSRIPLSITTRLRTYQNMVIEALTPQDASSQRAQSGYRHNQLGFIDHAATIGFADAAERSTFHIRSVECGWGGELVKRCGFKFQRTAEQINAPDHSTHAIAESEFRGTAPGGRSSTDLEPRIAVVRDGRLLGDDDIRLGAEFASGFNSIDYRLVSRSQHPRAVCLFGYRVGLHSQ